MYAQSSRVETLLAEGVDRKTLHQALFYAATSQPVCIVKSGGDSNFEKMELRYAETVRVILKYGASVEARGEQGTPLIAAAQHGETAVVRLLLERGAAIEATSTYGSTALIAACCSCHSACPAPTLNVVKLLLDKGATLRPGISKVTLHF